MGGEGEGGWDRRSTAHAYLQLEKPSEAEPVRYFASVENGLYDAILNMCVQPGKMCMSEMHHIDATGGGGTESHANHERLDYDNRRWRAATSRPAPPSRHRAARRGAASQPEGMTPATARPCTSGSSQSA